ncbi:hypothetical protein GCM10009764_55530 [Nocardia ninae]|uniref:Uncharacterized protein n=1 Tax=Nocardia ninae NBRC 108245 TaxID=1210091 RepID=A0A511M5A5_9NOCA|nr:hypothetical protein NN4_03140 [Nocardia ninae NBRC 108245]
MVDYGPERQPGIPLVTQLGVLIEIKTVQQIVQCEIGTLPISIRPAYSAGPLSCARNHFFRARYAATALRFPQVVLQ